MIDPCEFSNSQLKDLVPYEPGKPIEDVARELGLDALRKNVVVGDDDSHRAHLAD